MKKLWRLVVIGVAGLSLAAGSAWAADGGGHGGDGGMSGGSGIPADVQARIDQFKQDRANFLAKQQALLKQLKNATAAQRQAIRQQIRNQYEALRSTENDLKQQLRFDVDKLRQEFKNNRDRMINSAKGQAGDNRHRGGH